ncbi:hypothetical protein DTW90_35750 [Neorhizobium sp. P12A]|nr:hypothetical protein DTW90_35750 [Neorhizobium sp. P12A]
MCGGSLLLPLPLGCVRWTFIILQFAANAFDLFFGGVDRSTTVIWDTWARRGDAGIFRSVVETIGDL